MTPAPNDDVYAAVEELIAHLGATGYERLATVVDHRMNQVAWTDRSEAIDEIRKVLVTSLAPEEAPLPKDLRREITEVLRLFRTP